MAERMAIYSECKVNLGGSKHFQNDCGRDEVGEENERHSSCRTTKSYGEMTGF